jgi:hypothetical protein
VGGDRAAARGGFIFVVGWFVGLVLLWSSRAWSVRDKWIGRLLIPGGLATTVLGLGALATVSIGSGCSGSVVGGPPGQHLPSHVAQSCTGASTGHEVVGVLVLVLILVVLVGAPIATSIYLSRRARSAHVAA